MKCELLKLKEIQTVLNEAQLKLQRATDTRSHQNAVEPLRKVFRPLHMMLEQEAADGEALGYGLHKEIEKPSFIANLLFLSNVLTVLGNLSRTFQLSQTRYRTN